MFTYSQGLSWGCTSVVSFCVRVSCVCACACVCACVYVCACACLYVSLHGVCVCVCVDLRILLTGIFMGAPLRRRTALI